MTDEELRQRYPHYFEFVPQDDEDEYLRFRAKMLQHGFASGRGADELKLMCSQDMLFWINTFGWLLEPRKTEGKRRIPFNTTGAKSYQVRYLAELQASAGKYDIHAEKSRTTGFTWQAVYASLWFWLFQEDAIIGVSSKDEATVDTPRNFGTFMPRYDFALDRRFYPEFLRPSYVRQANHTFFNNDTGSLIVGFAATGDMATAQRFLIFILDEFAKFGQGGAGNDTKALKSVQHTSNCRWFISTHAGMTTEFYQMLAPKKKNAVYVRCHWSEDKDKAAGLYTSYDGKVDVLDKSYDFPDDYEFITAGPFFFGDGKVRSPYFDDECERPGATPKAIAEELEIDPAGSVTTWFDLVQIDKLIQKARLPLESGNLSWDKEDGPVTFSSNSRGRWKFWCELVGGRPPEGTYALGSDVASGKGGDMSSNSTIEIRCCRTGRKMAEFADATIDPVDMAYEILAVAKWFYEPLVVVEANGPGAITLKRLSQLGYMNIYLRDQDIERKSSPKTKKMGFWSTPPAKTNLLADYRKRLESGQFDQPSLDCLEEHKHWVYGPNGAPEHSGALAAADPSGAKANHGDRVIAAALTTIGIKEHQFIEPEKGPSGPEPGTLAWAIEDDFRRQSALAAMSRDDQW